MYIYRIALRNLMDTATNLLAQKALNIIIKLYETQQLFSKKKIKLEKEARYPGIGTPINVIIRITTLTNRTDPPFDINALYSSIQPDPYEVLANPTGVKSKNRQIEIFINIAPNFSHKSFNDFYMQTVVALRHELTHLIQDQKGMPIEFPNKGYDIEKMKEKDPLKRFTETRNYLTSLFEQEPFIRGFMLSCKKQGIPILPTLQKFIHEQLFTNNIAVEKEIKRVHGLEADHAEPMLMKLYQDRIQEMFPNTQNIS